MKTTSAFARLLVFAAVGLLPAAQALAGGPLAVCESGRAFLWPAGGANIPFNPDQGDLGPLDHAQAVTATAAAFSVWAAVPTSTATYVNAGELPLDVNITNFVPFLNAPAPDGLSAIVFDDTGEIFDLLFGPGSGVLGFAGPEWANVATCEITEGLSFLNGPSFAGPDPVAAAQAARDVMVHEFGHYSGLAHTVVNGQIFLAADHSGPTPNNTFGTPASITLIETMYPFYFGPGSGTESLHADDSRTLSTFYPEAGFAAATAAIAGRILAPDGTTRLSGVNVVARNVADPFLDASSAISGDYGLTGAQSDPFTGTYRLSGLTPAASYAVYVDQVLAGGFSTPPISLPGPEEFYNGASESSDGDVDNPALFTSVSAPAGGERSGTDIIFNEFEPGDHLPVGDDGAVQLSLGFSFALCGQSYSSVFVNANGSLTFGAASPDFSETVPEFLAGPPRIAALWDDLDASAGGVVTFDRSSTTFSVSWTDVPEFGPVGANTFSITLKRGSNQAEIVYGALSAKDGLAGVSCGGAVTSGFENEENLRGHGTRRTISMSGRTAAFEIFTEADNDLADYELLFTNMKQGFADVFEPNDTLARARSIRLPFSTESLSRNSTIAPVGADIDYYRFSAKAGDILAIEVVRGTFDALVGVFDADSGQLLIVNDDGGAGLLSRLILQANVDIRLAVAVTEFGDGGFTGAGDGGGRYVLSIKSYRGTVLAAGDDTSTPVALATPFRYQGQSWSSLFVNSNGNLTFGAPSADFSETVPELLAGPPRIAPLWDDLDATFGLAISSSDHGVSSIHFVSVPEFFSDSPNYFSVHLLPLGLYAIDYGATARSDALVGVTQGNGAADPGEEDISDRFPILSGRGTLYEQFVAPDPGDLSFVDLLFLPI
jgi:hypothetical protein